MKKLMALILALAVVLSLAACAGKTEPTTNTSTSPTTSSTTSEAPKEKNLVFGVAMPQLDNDGFKANLIGIKQFAEENGIELIVTDAKATADAQMQQIEDLITKKVKAIVMCPVDSGALAAAVEKAKAAGIPVISFDRNVEGNILTGLAESDNIGI